MSTTDQATVTTEPEHQTDVSLAEAIEGLTVGEVAKIERHYGRSLDGGKLSGTDLTVSVVWALERRRALKDGAPKLPDWKDLEDWTMKQLNSYFPPEAVEVDPASPETAEGKDATPAG
jgi:hypothetical protein